MNLRQIISPELFHAKCSGTPLLDLDIFLVSASPYPTISRNWKISDFASSSLHINYNQIWSPGFYYIVSLNTEILQDLISKTLFGSSPYHLLFTLKAHFSTNIQWTILYRCHVSFCFLFVQAWSILSYKIYTLICFLT